MKGTADTREAAVWRRLPPIFVAVLVVSSATGQVLVLLGFGPLRAYGVGVAPPIQVAAVLVSICMFGAVALHGGLQAIISGRSASAALDEEVARVLAAVKSSGDRAADYRAFDAERSAQSKLSKTVFSAGFVGMPSSNQGIGFTGYQGLADAPGFLRQAFGAPASYAGSGQYVETSTESELHRAGSSREFAEWSDARDVRRAVLDSIMPNMPVISSYGRELGRIISSGSEQLLVEALGGRDTFVVDQSRVIAVDEKVVLDWSESGTPPSPVGEQEQVS